LWNDTPVDRNHLSRPGLILKSPVASAISGHCYRGMSAPLEMTQTGSRKMMEIDRRTMLRTALSGAAFVAAGGGRVAAGPRLGQAVRLAADKVAPIETEDHCEEDNFEKDHFDGEGHVEQVQYWRGRGPGWRGRRWRWRRAYARGPRRVCRWRYGRLRCFWI